MLLIHDDELAAHFSSPFIAWHAHAPAASPDDEMLYDAIKDCDARQLWADLANTDLARLFPPSMRHVSLSTNILWSSQLFANPRYRAGASMRPQDPEPAL